MKYDEALEYINTVTAAAGIVPGLESIGNLCERLGNPQEKLKFVHIAGTNGKGSTLAFISTILLKSGYKVGMYSSPAVIDYREKFRVNNHFITKKAFADYIDVVKGVCEEMVLEGLNHPTAFEIETALSFLYFRDCKCDVVVLETGMGGRFDATNIINTSQLAVLTSVSMDHTQYLGETIGDIAWHKCGIIKKNVPVVSAAQIEEVSKIIKDNCRECVSEVVFVDRSNIQTGSFRNNKQRFTYKKVKYQTSLLGAWQPENAALAIEAVNNLKKQGYDRIKDNSIGKGIEQCVWRGRFEIVSSKPLVIVDGAHNIDAALRLRETIDNYYPDKEKIYIMGMFRDKDVTNVAKTIVSDGKMVFCCATPGSKRALSPIELADIIREYNSNVTACDSVYEAVEFAQSVYNDNCVIIACGSLAYLGKIIDIFGIK